MKIFLIITLVVLSVLVGCQKDPERASYEQALQEYGTILKDGITEKNTEDAKAFAIRLKVIIGVQHDTGKLAESAKDKLGQLQKLGADRKKTVASKLEEQTKPVIAELTQLEKIMKPIDDQARKERGFRSEKITTNLCFASDITSEFDSTKSIFDRLTLEKTVKVGEKEAVVEIIYKGSMFDVLHPQTALKKTNETKTVYQTELWGEYRVSCDKAERIAGQYRSILEKSTATEGLVGELQALNSVLSSDLM